MKSIAVLLCLSFSLPAAALEAADDSALSEAAGDTPGTRTGCAEIAEANIGTGPRFRPEVLSDASITRTFEAHARDLNAPYLRARESDPCLQGSLLFRITVNAAGSVTALSYRASNQNIARLGEKMAPIINQVRFEAPGRSDTFEHMISLFPDMSPD